MKVIISGFRHLIEHDAAVVVIVILFSNRYTYNIH